MNLPCISRAQVLGVMIVLGSGNIVLMGLGYMAYKKMKAMHEQQA